MDLPIAIVTGQKSETKGKTEVLVDGQQQFLLDARSLALRIGSLIPPLGGRAVPSA